MQAPLTDMRSSRQSARDTASLRWPGDAQSRVPAWIYSDPEIFAREMQVFHHGPTWNLVAAECELPVAGSWKRSSIADKSVLVTRDQNGEIHVMENRCTHRGIALCWKHRGQSRSIVCPYHNWTFDLKGALKGVPFEHGTKGAGGMPESFDKAQHGLRKLAVTVRGAAVWASFSDNPPAFEDYVGPVLPVMDRITTNRRPKLLGTSRQVIDCNWKLWMENARDGYHATLLHTFLPAFGLLQPDTPMGQITPHEGHVITGQYLPVRDKTAADPTAAARPAGSRFLLNDMDVVTTAHDEFGDNQNIGFQLFPGAMYRQHLNIPSYRQIIPRGPRRTEVQWTIFGDESDDEEMTLLRLKQANLVGPAGFVLVEDSEVLAKIQASVESYPESVQVTEMGGSDAGKTQRLVAENGIRAFYTYYRAAMGL